MDGGQPKRRRRSRHRFRDIPDLTEVLHSKRPAGVKDLVNSAEYFRKGQSENPVSDSHADADQDLDVLRSAVMEAVPLAEEAPDTHFFDSDVEDSDPSSPGTHLEQVFQESAVSLRISNWQVLWGLLRTNGSHKFTKAGYQAVRNLIEVISRKNSPSWRKSASTALTASEKANELPHYSTLHRHYRPILMRELAPRFSDQLVNLNMSKAGARATPQSMEIIPQGRVRIILPSEYARADIATPPVWSQLKSTSLAAHEQNGKSFRRTSLSSKECVDIWPLVAAREWFYGQQSALHLHVERDLPDSSAFAEAGDVISVSLLHAPEDSPERFQRCFGADDASSEYKTVKGTVIHCWTVHHASRRGHPSFVPNYDPAMSIRDRKIVDEFTFTSYTSPSDAVHVSVPEMPSPITNDSEIPEICTDDDTLSDRVKKPRVGPEISESVRKRRRALKQRKSEMESAWRSWKKPILKPGDFVTMLRPCIPRDFSTLQSNQLTNSALLTSVDMGSRVFVVSRFWVENEEQDSHLFWISGSESMETVMSHSVEDDIRLRSYCAPLLTYSSSITHLDVRCVKVMAQHEGSRGPARYTPVSSLGTLISGESYFVYRFILYWDGFEVQKGKSATGEGFYLICLNLPLAARGSPAAVRVLSLTPPGVSCEEVLSSIFTDVVKGMTTGFVDYDADGNRQRIFLDLVAFLGDTPAVNSVLDVLGHTSTACCHLCRFRRASKTLIGTRYAAGCSHGMVSPSMRTYFRHTAVRDSGATSETCRLLGIQFHMSPVAKIMLQLRDSMFNARHSIPRTSTGQFAVPYNMDPYRACLVAPDHLLTGHLRDCIALSLRLLPSSFYRTTCEKFMMGFLADASLPVQNRLVDHTKKSLFSMTMSELYSLSSVVDAAFAAACMYASRTPHAAPLSAKCQEALSLVQSCANLISQLWYFPRLHLDGYRSVQIFECKDGLKTISHLQSITEAHLNKIACICHMSDSDFLLLQDRQCPKNRKSELSKVMRECLIAIKTVDKPNTHRLRELAHTTLPLLGYIGRVGELVLEKTHQTLKRSIQQSNNRDVHLHALTGAAFADWQGRLTMIARAASAGDESALRCSYRLLAGREAVAAMRGALNPNIASEVALALGPNGCLIRELDDQGQLVLSPRTSTAAVSWKIMRPLQAVPYGNVQVPQHHQRHLKLLQGAYGGNITRFKICVGDAVTSTNANGARVQSFRSGDIVEILTYYPTASSFHFPFLVQPNCMNPVSSWQDATGPSLWCIQSIFSIEPPQGSTRFLSAVLPCSRVTSETHNTVLALRFPKYKVNLNERISFARLEESVRPVGVLHDCFNSTCYPTPNKIALSHSPDMEPGKGGEFFALTRRDGYPPRKG